MLLLISKSMRYICLMFFFSETLLRHLIFHETVLRHLNNITFGKITYRKNKKKWRKPLYLLSLRHLS